MERMNLTYLPGNLTTLIFDDFIDGNATAEHCPTGGATLTEFHTYHNVIGFWLDVVTLRAVGCVGIVLNTIALPILLSREDRKRDLER